MAKDFNHLKRWLETRMKERRIWYHELWQKTVEQDPNKQGVSLRTLYNWTQDVTRPTTQAATRVVHALSSIPAWDITGEHLLLVEIKLEEMLTQFSERKMGRPRGSGGGSRELRSRA